MKLHTKVYVVVAIAFVSFVAGAVLSNRQYRGQASVNVSAAEVGFSPSHTAKALVLKVIAQCEGTLRMATYSFTDADIRDALIAKHNSTDIQIVSDAKGNADDGVSVVDDLQRAGIKIRRNKRYAIHHHKFIACTGPHNTKIVETGSFNYTASADKRNAENSLVLWDAPAIYDIYMKEWERLYDESST
jgi:phosphatidylserine/phosphatidylglycerophosphate/cardiolipin synthase-like enzyme